MQGLVGVAVVGVGLDSEAVKHLFDVGDLRRGLARAAVVAVKIVAFAAKIEVSSDGRRAPVQFAAEGGAALADARIFAIHRPIERVYVLDIQTVAFVGGAGAVQVGPAVKRAVVAQARLEEVAGEGRGFLGPDGKHAHRRVEPVGGQPEIGESVGYFALGFGRRGELYLVKVARRFGQRIHALLHNFNFRFLDFAPGLAAGAGRLGGGTAHGEGGQCRTGS